MLQYTVFITGANRGLGLEFVRQFATDKWRVLASCRNLVQAKELQHLAQYFNNITLLQLDVTNQIQLEQLSEKLANTSIDLLINNANLRSEDDLQSISIEGMKQSFIVNAVAPLRIAAAFQENIARSHLKTIVTISNKMGSITENKTGESYSYRASKAALNMLMKTLAVDLRSRHIKVFTLHPGTIKAEPRGQASSINAIQSVKHIRSLLHRLTDRETGNFYDYSGKLLEW